MRMFLSLVLSVIVCSSVFAADQYGLEVGAIAPDFTSKNYKGEDVRFYDLLEDGPAVLVFYRGGWCYYCNLQLREFEKERRGFEKYNAKVIALSVDKVEKAAEWVVDKDFTFEVISNTEADILHDYNLVFQVPEDLAKMYKEKYDIDLEEASGRTDRIIAIPGVVVVDPSKEIIFSYANEDYKVRKTPEEILTVLEEWKNAQ